MWFPLHLIMGPQSGYSLLISLLAIILQCEVVSAGGMISIRLVSYVNPEGEGNNGHCCDGRSFLCPSGGGCDHYFVICVDSYASSDSMSDQCAMGSYTTGITWDSRTIDFGSTIGRSETPNPMVFSFQRWSIGAKLKVEIYDKDGNSDDFVDYVTRRIRASPDRNAASASALRQTLYDRTTLTMDVKVYCMPNYYGADCATFCRSTDSQRGHYTCNATGQMVCNPGWSGSRCDVSVDECTSNPCQFGGTCHDLHNSYTCTCPSGTSGTHCEVNEDECLSGPCQNGGTCLDGLSNYTCTCPLPWMGHNCEVYLSPCGSDPCLNNGTCLADPGELNFTCQCLESFQGSRCDEVSPCASAPCLHGGFCTNWNTTAKCACSPHWQGEFCGLMVDPCQDDPCLNQATCRLLLSEPCQNSSQCDEPPAFTCICNHGYTGELCDLVWDADENVSRSIPPPGITVHYNPEDERDLQTASLSADVTLLMEGALTDKDIQTIVKSLQRNAASMFNLAVDDVEVKVDVTSCDLDSTTVSNISVLIRVKGDSLSDETTASFLKQLSDADLPQPLYQGGDDTGLEKCVFGVPPPRRAQTVTQSKSWTESNWPILVGSGAALLLLIVIVACLLFFRRSKTKYNVSHSKTEESENERILQNRIRSTEMAFDNRLYAGTEIDPVAEDDCCGSRPISCGVDSNQTKLAIENPYADMSRAEIKPEDTVYQEITVVDDKLYDPESRGLFEEENPYDIPVDVRDSQFSTCRY